jgi:hypothetical protein
MELMKEFQFAPKLHENPLDLSYSNIWFLEILCFEGDNPGQPAQALRRRTTDISEKAIGSSGVGAMPSHHPSIYSSAFCEKIH